MQVELKGDVLWYQTGKRHWTIAGKLPDAAHKAEALKEIRKALALCMEPSALRVLPFGVEVEGRPGAFVPFEFD